MNRRDFLALFSSASLLSIAPVESLGKVGHRTFVSEAFSFSFDYPAGWHCSGLEETKANLEKQTLEDSPFEEEAEKLAPLVSFSRHKEPHPEMNPIAIVYADYIPEWVSSPLKLTYSYVDSFGEFVQNGRCVEDPHPCMIGGVEAIKTQFAYDCVVESDAFTHEVLDESYIIFHRGYVLWFLFEASYNGEQTAHKEFEFIKNTLQFL